VEEDAARVAPLPQPQASGPPQQGPLVPLLLEVPEVPVELELLEPVVLLAEEEVLRPEELLEDELLALLLETPLVPPEEEALESP
jgi:hypothetical protein